MCKVTFNIVLLASIILYHEAMAQPAYTNSIVTEGETLFRDVKQINIWYYMPPAYKLLSDADGRPSLTLMQMRFTGTNASGNNGKLKTHNILQFKIGTDSLYKKKLDALKAAMQRMYPGSQLRLLPIRKFSSLLVFANTSAGSGNDSVSTTKTNGFSEPGDENADVNNSYWNERVISFRLTDQDAMLVTDALKKHQAALSFAYAYYTVFSDTLMNQVTTNAENKIKQQINEVLKEENKSDSNKTMIRADAIPIKADIIKWPSCISMIDINEKLPAKYPALTVYCLDFNNELREDLFSKKIEIKARSVNGTDIINSFTFHANKPDQFARNIKFAYAVRFDKPFYIKVTEVNNDGDAAAGEWIEKKDWTEMVDITSPVERQVRKIKNIEEEN
jgi:hypothetical protein